MVSHTHRDKHTHVDAWQKLAGDLHKVAEGGAAGAVREVCDSRCSRGGAGGEEFLKRGQSAGRKDSLVEGFQGDLDAASHTCSPVSLCKMRIFGRFHYVWYLVSVTKRC